MSDFEGVDMDRPPLRPGWNYLHFSCGHEVASPVPSRPGDDLTRAADCFDCEQKKRQEKYAAARKAAAQRPAARTRNSQPPRRRFRCECPSGRFGGVCTCDFS